MQNHFMRFIKGYVKIRLETSMPERFVSLCAKNKIILWNLNYHQSYYECEISANDFFCLAPFRRKTSAHIVILEKHGLPFFFQMIQKRKAFFLGILLCILLLVFNSTILWDIRVNGNSYYSDETVLEELHANQIHSGMQKRKLNCKDIAAQIRNAFPNVVWVSAKLEGCCLILDIKENENPNEEKLEDELKSWNLMAERGGEIVKMITRTGVPLVQEGDSCEAGDVLVQGIVEILNQDLQVARLEYVGADADIQIKTTYAYYDEFSLDYPKKIYSNTSKKWPVIRVGSDEFTYMPELSEMEETFYEEIPLFLTDSFPLPISFGWIELREFRWEEYTLTEEEAKELAFQHLQTRLEEMSAEGKSILEHDLTFSITGYTAFCKGNVWVLESAVVRQPISKTDSEIVAKN